MLPCCSSSAKDIQCTHDVMPVLGCSRVGAEQEVCGKKSCGEGETRIKHCVLRDGCTVMKASDMIDDSLSHRSGNFEALQHSFVQLLHRNTNSSVCYGNKTKTNQKKAVRLPYKTMDRATKFPVSVTCRWRRRRRRTQVQSRTESQEAKMKQNYLFYIQARQSREYIKLKHGKTKPKCWENLNGRNWQK